MKKINLGSGAACLGDWINVDGSFNARLAKYPRWRYLLFKIGILSKKYYEVPWSKHIQSIIVRDVRKKLPFDDESIDFIYSSHLIEHLRKDVAEKVLKDCFRVLKRGGLIRLVIPDLELMARNYIKEIENIRNNKEKKEYLPSERFLDMFGMGERTKTPLILKIFSSGSRHRWMYDQFSLTALLESCGFIDIQKRNFKEGKCPDIDFLDNRPEHSIYLEARKPWEATMKKGEVFDKNSKFMQALDMKSLRNLIYNWKPRYILNYKPRYIFNRTKLFWYEFRYPDYPWLTQQANTILSTLLKPTDVGLEWGSGRSTLWFAQRIKHITSVEHDEAWYKAVSSKLQLTDISNVNYLFCKVAGGEEKRGKSPYIQVVNAFNKESIDFVLVDGIYRDVCANAVLEKICPGGIIVIDDANRYIPCDSIAPNSRPINSAPASEEWTRFSDCVKDWRLIWTSNGVKDTAIWFKPSGGYNEKL